MQSWTQHQQSKYSPVNVKMRNSTNKSNTTNPDNNSYFDPYRNTVVAEKYTEDDVRQKLARVSKRYSTVV
jgi:hypothetical protein